MQEWTSRPEWTSPYQWALPPQMEQNSTNIGELSISTNHISPGRDCMGPVLQFLSVPMMQESYHMCSPQQHMLVQQSYRPDDMWVPQHLLPTQKSYNKPLTPIQLQQLQLQKVYNMIDPQKPPTQPTRAILMQKFSMFNGNKNETQQKNQLYKQSYYRYQSAVEAGGVKPLFEKSRHQPNMKNRTDEATETRILTFPVECPPYGQLRSNELRRESM